MTAQNKILKWLPILLVGIVGVLAIRAMTNGMAVKSLLLDEAFFARNLRLFPDGYAQQSAPSAPLFYGLTYLLIQFFGTGEWVYRLLPSLSAIAGMGVLGWFLWKHFSKPASIFAIILSVGSIPLIEYGANAHPYATDFFFSALLLAIMIAYLQSPSTKLWIIWNGVAFLAVALSMPAIFVVVSMAFVLILRHLLQKDFSGLWKRLLGLIPVGTFILLIGIFVYMEKAGSRRDMWYWADNFPSSLAPQVVAKWSFAATNKLLGFFYWNFQEGLIGLFIVLLGTAWLIRQKKCMVVGFCWLPVLMAMGAAVFQKWPYGPLRVMLYALPFFSVLLAAGLESLWKDVKSRQVKIIIGIACFILLIPQSWILGRAFEKIEDSEEAIRSLSETVVPMSQSNDKFFVYYAAEVQFQYYFHDSIEQAVFLPWELRGQRDEMEAFIESHIQDVEDRFWLIFSHVVVGEDQTLTEIAGKWGTFQDQFVFPGCKAVLFKLKNEAQDG